VTVVTTLDSEGAPLGFTANSFTSVSLDPPMVLVCLANASRSHKTFTQAGGFAVNILAENQIDISNTFARPMEDRFANIKWYKGPKESPVFDGVSCWFDCSMHKTIDAGDHVILIGQVEAFEASNAAGLGYARGAYVTPSTTAKAVGNNTNLIVSALIEKDGQILLVDDGNGGLGLPETLVGTDGASTALRQLIASTGLQTEPGFVYSVFEDVVRKRQHISFLCQVPQGVPKTGAFVPLTLSALDDVTDPAVSRMLERLAGEYALKNFGIYYGNHERGEVRPISERS